MPSVSRVGGDIDAWCTRCKMLLGHTVLAMVGNKPARVRCNTCQGEHAYKAGPPGTGAPATGKGSWQPRSVREKPQVTTWEARLAQKDVASARRYTPKETFIKEQVLQHPTFGIGIVEDVRGDKIEVAFKADVKTLVHGKH
jgi:hypothetical protein